MVRVRLMNAINVSLGTQRYADEIADAIRGNPCRCNTKAHIIDAIEYAHVRPRCAMSDPRKGP